MDVDYRETFIAVAEDCPVVMGVAPEPRAGKTTIAVRQFELIRTRPYALTSAEILFETAMRHRGVSEAQLKSRRKALWDEFFGAPQACLRASPLPKKYGWGFHCDAEGRVVLVARESREYARLRAECPKVVKALRSRRA